MRHLRGRHVVRTRRQLLPDALWYRSATWNEYHRPIKIDDQLTSVYQGSDGRAIHVIAVHRAVGEREFSPRQQELLRLFHAELGRLIGHSLTSATEPCPDALSPRLRQTLACLLEGDTERHVASRLRLSPATVHEYVTVLYRHFGVRSRAQLMAHAMKRLTRREWEELQPR